MARDSDCLPTGDLLPVVVARGELLDWKGLNRCFSKDAGFRLVTCSGPFEEALAVCRRLTRAVLIVEAGTLERADPSMLGSALGPARLTRLLARVNHNDPVIVEDLLRMGCAGVLGEKISTSTLRRAVRTIGSGEIWASRRLISRILQECLFDGKRRLTEREREILTLIGGGYKNQEIATQLFISRETVRWHVKSLYAKIGVQDRLSAAVYAKEHSVDERPPSGNPIPKPPERVKTLVPAAVPAYAD